MGDKSDEFTLVLNDSFRRMEHVRIEGYIRRSDDLLDALDGLERELDELLDAGKTVEFSPQAAED